MRQLLILFTFIAPILLNAQEFCQYLGLGFGTLARTQQFKSSSLNGSVDYRITFTNNNFGLGFIYSYDFFPKYNYLNESIQLSFTNVGADFFLSSKYNNFLIGGTIEFPLVIDDGFHKSQKKRPIPSINIGISEKKFTLLLSYKYYTYKNNYKANLRNDHFDVIETVRISTIRLVLKYQMTRKALY